MARVLKVEGYVSGSTDLVTVDFQSDLILDERGWETGTAVSEVWERLDVYSNNSDSDLRAIDEKLTKLGGEARLYISKTYRPNPVWFYFQSEGEGVRRAVVKDIQSVYRNYGPATSPLQGFSQAYVSVAIQRLPGYEPSTTTTDYQAGSSDFNIFGGQWLVGNDAGSSGQRIAQFVVSNSDTVSYRNVWVGIRGINEGTSDFVSLWEAEDGTNVTTDAVDVGPAAGASGAAAVEIDFSATEAMAERNKILLTNVIVGTNSAHFIGEYMILGSFHLGSTDTECLVRLEQNWNSNSGYGSLVGGTLLNVTDYPYIADTDIYKFVELGSVQIPPEGYRNSWIATDRLNNMTFSLYAQRVTGTGSLFYDCLVLIPTDHFFSAKFPVGSISTGIAGQSGLLHAYTSPEGKQWARIKSSAGLVLDSPYEYAFENWEYPVGGGLLVYAAQADSDGHPVQGFLDLGIELVPRWPGYRS